MGRVIEQRGEKNLKSPEKMRLDISEKGNGGVCPEISKGGLFLSGFFLRLKAAPGEEYLREVPLKEDAFHKAERFSERLRLKRTSQPKGG